MATRRRWSIFLAGMLLAGGLLGLGYFLRRQGLERADQWASVGALFVSILALVLTVLDRHDPGEPAVSVGPAETDGGAAASATVSITLPPPGAGDRTASDAAPRDPLPGGTPVAWDARAYVNHEQLFGVDQIIRAVTESVRSPHASDMVSIYGDGGIGKTAVAFEAVRRCTDGRAFTRVAWASAATVDDMPGSAVPAPLWHDIVEDLARQLDIALGPSRALWRSDLADSVRRLPPTERILVVLDNLERLEDATGAIRDLREIGIRKPHQLLVTTRWQMQPVLSQVAEFKVAELRQADAVTLIKYLGRDDEALSTAPVRLLAPILDLTGGNPFLIRLAIRQYLASHRPLDLVMDEFRALPADPSGGGTSLASSIRDYLYVRSLTELERRYGVADADAIMATFCAKGKGDSFSYEDLQTMSGIAEPAFGGVLSGACQLSLVTSFGRMNQRALDRGYTIHSLLYDYTCNVE